jgi:aryl-alcohol dehydrogenase-like predicted oxidoreductase
MDSRPLGDSGLTVSRLSLGSWRTFERISRDTGLEVMRAAREAGITFLDDARYDDETGIAPIRSSVTGTMPGRSA